jgi:hypothetical protein
MDACKRFERENFELIGSKGLQKNPIRIAKLDWPVLLQCLIQRKGRSRLEIKETDATKFVQKNWPSFLQLGPRAHTRGSIRDAQKERMALPEREEWCCPTRRLSLSKEGGNCEECEERARERPPLLLVGPRDPYNGTTLELPKKKVGPYFEGMALCKQKCAPYQRKRQTRKVGRTTSAHLSCWLAPEAAVCCACACKISSRCCRGLSI